MQANALAGRVIVKNRTVAPYGSWKSPISSDMLVSNAVSLSSLTIESGQLYWLELRPSEGGRCVVVRRDADGVQSDMTPEEFNVRTRVHEYGGGEFVVDEQAIYFSNFSDQRLYRQTDSSSREPITPESPLRYADGVVDKKRNRMICVVEDHSGSGSEPDNYLATLKLDGIESAKPLVSGNDFYSSPRINDDGTKLAWMTWKHPNMQWDSSELWVADITPGGSLENPSKIAGGDNESICQPEWAPDGRLYFVSDSSGWWNVYRDEGMSPKPLCPMDAEFGMPHWVFGESTYAFDTADRLVCTYCAHGIWRLATIDTATGSLRAIDSARDFTMIMDVRAENGTAYFIAAGATEPPGVYSCDLATGKITLIKRSRGVEVGPGYISIPRPIEFPTTGGKTSHGFYYAPKNDDFTAPDGDRPPLIVRSHGGPTSATAASLKMDTQFWTSRGFAVLDVNYGGSTGYGREFRNRLYDSWGVVDVDDCVNGAEYLANKGDVDSERLIIRGGSAGGYTTLAALTFRKTFKAGASYYGVGDLEALAGDTHKFESRYMDRLVGPYPEAKETYIQRSPINFVEKLSCPVIFFQGLDDKVVPPNQSEKMVNSLRDKGLPVAYVPFEGEQHGFRKAENIKRSVEAELYFYSKLLGFELADDIKPVLIHNMVE